MKEQTGAMEEEPRVNLINNELEELEKGVENIALRLSSLKVRLLGIDIPTPEADSQEMAKEAREIGWFDKVHKRLAILNNKVKQLDSELIGKLMNAVVAQDFNTKGDLNEPN